VSIASAKTFLEAKWCFILSVIGKKPTDSLAGTKERPRRKTDVWGTRLVDVTPDFYKVKRRLRRKDVQRLHSGLAFNLVR
jgi:hypothetical protein